MRVLFPLPQLTLNAIQSFYHRLFTSPVSPRDLLYYLGLWYHLSTVFTSQRYEQRRDVSNKIRFKLELDSECWRVGWTWTFQRRVLETSDASFGDCSDQYHTLTSLQPLNSWILKMVILRTLSVCSSSGFNVIRTVQCLVIGWSFPLFRLTAFTPHPISLCLVEISTVWDLSNMFCHSTSL